MFGGKRLVFYELNEVPLRILNWFASEFPASAVAQLMRRSRVFETVTEDHGHLSPWITWPTLHRGVTNQQHTIFDFGQELQDINAEFPPLWDILARSGRKVGLFGSLHSYPLPDNLTDGYSFYVPDTFAAGPECFPKEMEAFQSFNLAMMDRSGRNVTSGIALREAASFLAKAPGLGLRSSTAMKLAGQLANERLKPERVVRRRTSQIQIAFDFFLKSLRAQTPEAAFFFTNHVASSMHRYWPALFPDDYRDKFWSEEWQGKWNDEIRFAMQVADENLRDLMRFVDGDSRYALVVASSMGQAAVDPKAVIRTQLYFSDIARFMRVIGFGDDEWSPARAMVPLYTVRVAPQLAEVFQKRCAEFLINGAPLAVEQRGQGVFRIEVGHANLDTESIKITFRAAPVGLSDAGLENVSVQDESGSYAYHIPQGSLLIYGLPQVAAQENSARVSLSTLEIAPAVLANFGISRRPYMAEPDLLARIQ